MVLKVLFFNLKLNLNHNFYLSLEDIIYFLKGVDSIYYINLYTTNLRLDRLFYFLVLFILFLLLKN